MKRKLTPLSCILVLCLTVAFTGMLSYANYKSLLDGASVMSVDLGTEFMKVAIVMPGIPMEVVPDGDSKRKTTTSIGFRDHHRLFGSEAANLAARQPEMVFERVPALLGKQPGHMTFKLYQQWYPYHNLTFDETTGQVILHHPTGVQYTAEELVGMLLDHAKGNAERYIMFDIQTCVITVPPHYGQAERRSLLRAAGLAGLEVLQLMNDNTAVALNFGLFRRGLFNATAQNVLFFDVGSMSTTATIASYHVGKHRERGATAEDPILTVLGVAPMPHMGTTFLIRRLSEHLAKEFVTKKNRESAQGIFNNTRSMAKLRVEASRVLNQLSANTAVFAQVEHLFEGEDFRVKVTRKELEELCADYFTNLRQPFQEALTISKMTMDSISDVVLMGGGTRIPKIQEKLRLLSGRDLGRGVNGDEAAVLGAVYQAAAQTLGFKVLPFVVRDYNLYPIAVDFAPAPISKDVAAAAKPEESAEDSAPFIRRLLFPRANLFPQKRSITFSRHTTDLNFYLNYVNLQVDEMEYLKTTNLSLVETSGVTEAIAQASHSESRGVKAHFSMDASGILSLTRVECLFQTIDRPDSESTLTKLGNTIGDFLGVGKASSEGGDAGSNATAGDQKQAPAPGDEKATGEKPVEQLNQSTNSTTTKGPVMYSKLVNFTLVHLDLAAPTEKNVAESKAKLDELRIVALEQQYLEHAINELETAILYVRSELDSTEFKQYTTEKERNLLSELNTKVSDWYDEQSRGTPREEYENRLSDINRLLLPIKLRLSEAAKRPSALAILETAVRESQGMVAKMRQMNAVIERLVTETMAASLANKTSASGTDGVSSATDSASANATSTGDSSSSSSEGTLGVEDVVKEESAKPPTLPSWATVFTETEITEFETSVGAVKVWLEKSKAELEAASLTDRPPVLAETLIEKKQQLTRLVLPYHRRLMHWQSEMEARRKTVAAAAAAAAQQPTASTSQPPLDVPKGFNNVSIELPAEEEEGSPPERPTDDEKVKILPREDL